MANIQGVFKNIGHFFATAISKVLTTAPKVVAAADKVAAVVAKDAPVVEGLTSLVPEYGPAGVKIEQAGIMVLGAIVGLIHLGGDAIQAKLLDLGLDKTAIDTAVDVYKKLPDAVKQMVK